MYQYNHLSIGIRILFRPLFPFWQFAEIEILTKFWRNFAELQIRRYIYIIIMPPLDFLHHNGMRNAAFPSSIAPVAFRVPLLSLSSLATSFEETASNWLSYSALQAVVLVLHSISVDFRINCFLIFFNIVKNFKFEST